jgi:hypothetical protein
MARLAGPVSGQAPSGIFGQAVIVTIVGAIGASTACYAALADPDRADQQPCKLLRDSEVSELFEAKDVMHRIAVRAQDRWVCRYFVKVYGRIVPVLDQTVRHFKSWVDAEEEYEDQRHKIEASGAHVEDVEVGDKAALFAHGNDREIVVRWDRYLLVMIEIDGAGGDKYDHFPLLIAASRSLGGLPKPPT